MPTPTLPFPRPSPDPRRCIGVAEAMRRLVRVVVGKGKAGRAAK